MWRLFLFSFGNLLHQTGSVRRYPVALKKNFLYPFLLFSLALSAQHQTAIKARLDVDTHVMDVEQTILFRNDTGQSLDHIVLNDWNNAYSGKDTPLAQRFSDEFVRSFHLSRKEERGHTELLSTGGMTIERLGYDLLDVKLSQPLAIGQEVTLRLRYTVKLPSDQFTHFGYGENGSFYLRDCFIAAARFENGDFLRYSNQNTDDSANASSDYDIELMTSKPMRLFSDLRLDGSGDSYRLQGKNRTVFGIWLTTGTVFEQFKGPNGEVWTDLAARRVDPIGKALVIDRVTGFVSGQLGHYGLGPLVVSQADYDRNPFYGLNQLPSFLSPFEDDFVYEIKFLKTYLNAYLRNTLKLDPRKDNWIYDGIQVYTMMRYMDAFHPEMKMMGNVAKRRLFKGYTITQLPFNEQYSYFFLLMARKNLDQAAAEEKDHLIKFNEQIATKYRSGLNFRYLASYVGDDKVKEAVAEFTFQSAKAVRPQRKDFESILREKAATDIDWFFTDVTDSRNLPDYKFKRAETKGDSVTFTIRNKSEVSAPIPVYGLKGKEVVFKTWIRDIGADSTFTVARNGSDRLAINYRNEVPEMNMRNNFRSLRSFRLGDRPLKLTFFRDLENPNYNQILFLPTAMFNVYDGVSPGIRFHNRTILDKPFMFDLTPIWSVKQNELVGNFNIIVNQNNRDSRLYNIRYQFGGSVYHYAPDAQYTKLNPAVWMRFRPKTFRDNRSRLLLLRNVMVKREASAIVVPDEETVNYNVFNARYVDSRTETVRHLSFATDLQVSDDFGKAYVEFGYRRLFNDNRQFNLRLFAGTFLYRHTESDYFSFALDRPTDYLFDYEYYGRSEKQGLFSRQIVIAEGGFKSMLDTPYANQWMTTANLSFNIWNWIEAYGDVGLVKNELAPTHFVYDSGIRLNLVTDYFELYFPVYSNNGWEIAQQGYEKRIRFMVTLNPKILVTLFTRKWF